jgi:hypothetical protein
MEMGEDKRDPGNHDGPDRTNGQDGHNGTREDVTNGNQDGPDRTNGDDPAISQGDDLTLLEGQSTPRLTTDVNKEREEEGPDTNVNNNERGLQDRLEDDTMEEDDSMEKEDSMEEEPVPLLAPKRLQRIFASKKRRIAKWMAGRPNFQTRYLERQISLLKKEIKLQ